MTKHARFFLLPSFILISAALIAGCNDKGEEKAHVGEPQVTVHIVKTARGYEIHQPAGVRPGHC